MEDTLDFSILLEADAINYEILNPDRDDILRKIDKTFGKLIKDDSGSAIKKELANYIKELTGVDHVAIKLVDDDIASIVTTYKLELAEKMGIFQTIKNLIFKKDSNYAIMDPKKYIDGIYIFLGYESLQLFTNRELTAIILHELGHAYAHTSRLPDIITHLGSWISGIGLIRTVSNLIYGALQGYGTYDPTITLLFFTISRTLKFIDHVGEYNSDKFAAKYGYGIEMTRVLNKLHLYTKDHEKTKSWLDHLYHIFKVFFFPTTHPTNKNRMCELIRKMKTDFQDQYPNLKKDLGVVLANTKCDSTIVNIGRFITGG